MNDDTTQIIRIDTSGTTPGYRAAAHHFDATPPSQRSTLVLGWLRSTDEDKACVAVDVLGQAGPDTVPALVREVCRSRRGPAYVCRLLDVIERIGAPLGPSQFLDLQMLMIRPKSEEVRNRLAEFFVRMRGVQAGERPRV